MVYLWHRREKTEFSSAEGSVSATHLTNRGKEASAHVHWGQFNLNSLHSSLRAQRPCFLGPADPSGATLVVTGSLCNNEAVLTVRMITINWAEQPELAGVEKQRCAQRGRPWTRKQLAALESASGRWKAGRSARSSATVPSDKHLRGRREEPTAHWWSG